MSLNLDRRTPLTQSRQGKICFINPLFLQLEVKSKVSGVSCSMIYFIQQKLYSKQVKICPKKSFVNNKEMAFDLKWTFFLLTISLKL